MSSRNCAKKKGVLKKEKKKYITCKCKPELRLLSMCPCSLTATRMFSGKMASNELMWLCASLMIETISIFSMVESGWE